MEHFRDHYYSCGADAKIILAHDLTDADDLDVFFANIKNSGGVMLVGIINYDLIFRREKLLKIHYDTLMLDESSMIQNDRAKRTRAILKLRTKNVILLSGTPTGGRYERLYSQMRLLGWDIKKKDYYDRYIVTHEIDVGGARIKVVDGYKNVNDLKKQMWDHGCHFLRTEDVFDLPQQVFSDVEVKKPPKYKEYMRHSIVTIGDKMFVGDSVLKKLLYARMVCGAYSTAKLQAVEDILDSTEDRLIIFYNFSAELAELKRICQSRKRSISVVNGEGRDLKAYDGEADSVTLIQYQAGAMGLNLQRACRIVYFSPPLSSELYEQSKKRTHRIGQIKTCFYYRLICKRTVEERIYETLEKRQDYTERLFEKDDYYA